MIEARLLGAGIDESPEAARPAAVDLASGFDDRELSIRIRGPSSPSWSVSALRS